MGEKTSSIDISKFSFDQFMDFLFDREAPLDTKKRDPWYWHTEVTFDPERVWAHYVRLFQKPNFLLERFSRNQLEQGFWGIQSGNIDCAVTEIIWMEYLPFSLRETCVRSMFQLFQLLFAIEPLETSAHMWWDSLCFDWHCGNRNRLRGGEDLLMQDVMFQTLTEILTLDSEFCQDAALHGLGHLHHPETEQLVQKYLEQRPALDIKRREYALAAARFEVL
jgi:hypothetical protein